ncbi:MAG: class I SAM-dependent methyltransferase [Thiotrichaceae bacterium]|nr:class I SAM-dependent methyltransferase [Thiotrichaceae bacterium]
MKTYLDNICPLCDKIQSQPYFSDKKRDYLLCHHCYLVYVEEKFHISAIDEKKQYDFHTNNPYDQAYRQFLSRLFMPLKHQLKPGSKGLDFGSGPGPTLSIMFQEAGFDMQIYDLYYADNKDVFNSQYDFISATEVIEHIKNPAQEIKRLLSIIKPDGVLGLMTKLVIDRESFKNWHYKNDITHICFYSKKTFMWIANKYQLSVSFIDSDVIILKKSANG